jgi:ABC-type transport system substrate-binding protein
MRGPLRTSCWARLRVALMATCALLLSACNNDPWPSGSAASNMLYTSMVESTPRHLDPTASYWSNDTAVTYQVYEPLYGYAYLKRPYELIPKSAAEVVKPYYLDKNGQRLPDDAPVAEIAESVYDIPIKRGVMYQPHPCFATDAQGHPLYLHLKPGQLGDKRSPLDFPVQGTRELTADDFVYALKRHATTRITAPIFSTFAQYVVGLKDYGELIKKEDAKLLAGADPASLDKPFLDFRKWPLAGASAPSKHLLRIKIIGKYPQWNYWMAMTFLAPVPWEADAFYSQPGMAQRGLSLDNWPVGTGPFMMTQYTKDRSYTLKRNPNYHGDTYPCEGTAQDKADGLLADCGKPLPFIDGVHSVVERESVPQRGKFRQGYYDLEVFERTDTGMAYLVEMQDSEQVRKDYLAKGFRFNKTTDVNSYFIAFNMLDPVIGQSSDPVTDERHRKLRQAIAIATDWEEYSKIFPKKAGVAAEGPIPAGIFGSREGTLEGVNPYTHKVVDGKIVRRSIDDAKKLMAEAGYPHGRDAKTGKPLVLSYDFYAIPTPERKPEIDWVVRQFAKIDIQLEVRATDNNQFQDKIRKGKYQVFWLGWNADYPDAENFLFLLTTSAGKTKYDGENTSNYSNAEYDRLFEQMRTLDNGPEKQALIDKMVHIAERDAPWTWGFFPYASAAAQHWVYNYKPAVLIRDFGKYIRLDVPQRVADVRAWNRPVWWPLAAIIAFIVALVALARHNLRKRERMNARGELLAN